VSTVFRPCGLIPVTGKYGAEPSALRMLRDGIASGYDTSIGKGDPVKLMTTGVLELAAAGEGISGVFDHCEYTDAAGERHLSPYWPASTVATEVEAYYQADVDGMLYRIQSNASLSSKAARGDSADLVIGTVNTRTGWSASYLAGGSLVGAGNSAQLKIVDLYAAPGNAWDDTYPEVLVMINERNLGLIAGNAI
jgi:hypothetical protein